MGAFEVSSAYLGNKLIQVITSAAHYSKIAFNHTFEEVIGDFGKKITETLKTLVEIAKQSPAHAMVALTAYFKKVDEEGMTLEDKLIGAAESLKNKVTKDSDPFGFRKAVDNFEQDLGDVLEEGQKNISQNINDQAAREREAKQRAEKTAKLQKDIFDRAFAPEEKPKAAPQPPKETTKDGLNIKRSKSVSESTQNKAARISNLATRMAVAHTEGFSGLTGLYQMQLQKSQGMAVGSQGAFAKDRSRLGVASGLQTGGLGAKRYTNPAREAARIAKEQKKDAREQIDVLRDVDKKLGLGLGLTAA